MGTQIKTVGFGGINNPVVKRAIGVLSDGTAVAVICDMNQTGVSGDGGDNTGVPKFYIYTSPDWATWTLRSTVAVPAAATQNIVASMCIDSANNIRIAYRWTASSLRYHQVNYSAGPTYTPVAGSEVVSAGPPSGYTNFSLVDIDTLGDGGAVAITGYYYNTTAGSKKTAVVSYVRTLGGSWVTHATDVMISGASHLGYADDLCMAGDNKTTVGGDNLATFAYNCVRKADNGTDFGDVLRLATVNVSTGARTRLDTIRSGHYAGSGGGFRKFWLFNRASNEFILAGVVNASPMQAGLLKFSWNRTINTATILVNATTGPSQGITLSRGSNNHNWCSVGWDGGDKFTFFGIGNGSAVCSVGQISVKSAIFPAGWQYWDNGYGNPTGFQDPSGQLKATTIAPVEQIFAGARRNMAGNRIGAMMFHHRNDAGSPQSFSMQFRGILLPFAPANVTPAASSTQGTDRPTLTADYRLQMYWAQVPVKTVWYIASDAGFTTNLHQIGEPDSKFILPNGTSPGYLKKVMASIQVPGSDELNQGTWYIRALTFDYLGSAGAWSPANSFTITHPPVPANLYPTGGAVFLYGGTGSVTFSWKFTDPSPYDSQTAYQIVIENADDGSVLLDSGKVTSTAQSATLSVPIGGKDINLRWKMKLWDSDDVQGPESPYQLFYTTDPPAPSVISPVGPPLNANPYFNTDVSNWSVLAGGAIVQSTGQFHEGTGSLQFTPDGTTATPEIRSENVTGISAGKSYSFPVWLRNAFARSVNANIVWRDGAGTFLSSAGAVSLNLLANTWASVKVEGIAPSGAAQAQLSVSMGSTPLATHVLNVDEAILRESVPTITTAIPTVQWSAGILGSKLQAAYRVRVTQGDALIYSSEWVNSLDTAHTIPVGYLVNNQVYTISVEVQDNLGLTGSNSVSVATDWVEPTPPDSGWQVFTQDYASRGYVYITWENNFFVDSDFAAWNVYRRRVGDPSWARIGSYTNGADRYAHRDYGVASGQTYEYMITQMVDRFGDLIESLPDKIVQVTPDSDQYWIVDLVEPEKSIPIFNVTSDNFKEEYEQETYSVIGRGRHVDYGERLGYSGSLNAQVRDKFLTGLARKNYALNPSFVLQSVTGQTPDRWTFSQQGTIAGEITLEYVESPNPSPSIVTPYRMTARQLGPAATDLIALSQEITGLDFPTEMTPGTTVTLSTWVGDVFFFGRRLKLIIDWLDSAGGTLSSGSATITDLFTQSVETYVSPTSADALRGNQSEKWRRFQFQTTVPGSAPKGARIKIQMEGDGTGGGNADARMMVTGVQFEIGSRSAYIDGNQYGVEWTGVPQLSSSATTGYYTARQQRQAIEGIKSRKTMVYLRNPFGDIWLVAPGDVGVNRIPGVGRSEFVDVEIPYQEVSF